MTDKQRNPTHINTHIHKQRREHSGLITCSWESVCSLMHSGFIDLRTLLTLNYAIDFKCMQRNSEIFLLIDIFLAFQSCSISNLCDWLTFWIRSRSPAEGVNSSRECAISLKKKLEGIPHSPHMSTHPCMLNKMKQASFISKRWGQQFGGEKAVHYPQ